MPAIGAKPAGSRLERAAACAHSDAGANEGEREAKRARSKATAAHKGKSRSSVDPDRADIAQYVADMTEQLAKLSGQAEFALLAYFLRMASQEAQDMANLCRLK